MSDAMKNMGYRRGGAPSPVERLETLRLRIEQASKGFLDWWFGELMALVPARLRDHLTGSRERLYLSVEGDAAELVSVAGDERTSLGRVDLSQPSTVQRALAIAAKIQGAEPVPVVLTLPASEALRTRFSLPAAAERNLDQVVGFEFERVTPFKREEACYAWRILARNKAAKTIDVELTILPRADIDAIVTAARHTNLKVTMIEIAGASAGDPVSVIPVEDGDIRTGDASARRVIAGLAIAAGLLAIVCIALPFIRADHRLNVLDAQMNEARAKADASLAVEKQIDALLGDRSFLADRRRRLPTVTELLDALTRLTPDDAWLTELQIEGDQIHLTGAAGSATGLLGVIDQSPTFSDAGFRASITQDGQLKRERFDITARIVPNIEPGKDRK